MHIIHIISQKINRCKWCSCLDCKRVKSCHAKIFVLFYKSDYLFVLHSGLGMPKEKYDPLDSRRMYTNTIMSIEEANSGKKSIWDGLEITGMSRSKPSARYFTLTSLLQWKWNIIKKERERYLFMSQVMFGVSARAFGCSHTSLLCTSVTTPCHASHLKLPSCTTLCSWTCRPIRSGACQQSLATWCLSGDLEQKLHYSFHGSFVPFYVCVIREWIKGILKLGFPGLISMLQMSITIIALKLLYVSSIFI